MIEQAFYDYFRDDLSALLPLSPTEASKIAARLDYENVYMLSAALSFFKSVKALDGAGDRHRRIRVLCTLFVVEAFVDVLNSDKNEPWKKLSWLLKEHLTDDETISLLRGFVFSEDQDIDTSERKPLYHIMRKSVIKDIDYLRKNVFGTLKPAKYPVGKERDQWMAEENRRLSEHLGPVEKTDPFTGRPYLDYRECTAPCDCETWLRHNMARKNKYLNELAQKIYTLRNSMAHHGFPVHFGVSDRPAMTMDDRCVCRSKSGALKAMSFAVTIQITDLTDILEKCLARALLAHRPTAKHAAKNEGEA